LKVIPLWLGRIEFIYSARRDEKFILSEVEGSPSIGSEILKEYRLGWEK
jgi:hypothetical protein